MKIYSMILLWDVIPGYLYDKSKLKIIDLDDLKRLVMHFLSELFSLSCMFETLVGFTKVLDILI